MDQHTIDKLLSAASKVDRLESLLQRLELQTSQPSPAADASVRTDDAPSVGAISPSVAAAAAEREAALLNRIAQLESQNRLLQQAILASHERSQHAAAVSLHETSAPPSVCDDSELPHTSLYAKRSTRSASIELQLFEEHMARGAEALAARRNASDRANESPNDATAAAAAAADLATTQPTSPSSSPSASPSRSPVREHIVDPCPLGLPPCAPPTAASVGSPPCGATSQKASFRLLRADSRQCEYTHVGNGRISLGVRSTNLVRLNWMKGPGAKQARNVLIVAKPGDSEVERAMFDIAVWLHAHAKAVWVEPVVKADATSSMAALPFLQSWSTPAQLAQLHLVIDLVVCLGGDGTLLWASNLFKTSVPPVLGFALGSLGFLSPFPIDTFAETLSKVFQGGFHLTLRSRLVCTIIKSKQNRVKKPDMLARAISDPNATSPPQAPTSNTASPSTADTVSELPQPQQPRLSMAKARHYSLSAQGFNTSLPHYRPTLPVNVPSPTPSPSPSPAAAAAAPDSNFASSTSSRHIRSHSLYGGAQSVGVELVDSADEDSDGSSASEGPSPLGLPRTAPSPPPMHDDMDALAADDVDSYVCMNEVIIDRGLSSYLTLLDAYVDGIHFTRVQADGIIVGTPTGSTAYSLSAGGSACHPEVPCMLFTPVCPHSLSFRPLLFPDTSTLQIKVSPDSRGSNCASFDGRHRVTLDPGDSLLISMSRWPLPSICRLDGTSDWFESVRSVLQWNARTASQKSLNPTSAAAIAAATPNTTGSIKRAHTTASLSSQLPPKQQADSASLLLQQPSPPHSESAPPPLVPA